MKLTKVKLGTVGVDAGLLMIIDPCYVKDLKEIHGSDEGWSKFVEHIYSKGNDTSKGIALAGGLTFASGYGDGEYTVYGYKDEDGCIIKVEIDMGGGGMTEGETCLTEDETKQVLEMVEYYIYEEQIVPKKETLQQVDYKLSLLVKKLGGDIEL